MCNTTADYAVAAGQSRGRIFPEKEHPYRSCFERDRDRIIHSEAFRRLEGKTQVFTVGMDDNYRNRLTHSIEVAQIGRTIARNLNLNENLTEAICLGHDLGHSPFGHAGEKILDDLMADFGGFEHNVQSLRIVDLLEHPYPDFNGLNLMYETRLALAKHSSPYDLPGENGFSEKHCSLEGQIADVADRIAYNCHDLEDGLRAKLIVSNQLAGMQIFEQARERICADKITDEGMRRTRVAKAIIDMLVSDCIETSREAIGAAGIKTVEDVYNHEQRLIKLSQESDAKLLALEDFLLNKFYLSPALRDVFMQVREKLQLLFDKFRAEPGLMTGFYARLARTEGVERVVCDYIAGMTDRYCLQMANKLGWETGK